LAEVVDVFEMTPVQSGMLLHTLAAPGSGTYHEQCWCLLEGPLDPERFRSAWRQVVRRHGMLRCEAHWSDLDSPVLVVYDDAEPEWHTGDWTDLDPEAQQTSFEIWLDGDRKRGFQPDRAPLLRFALFRLGENRHRFVWSFHHLLMDGWCGSLLVAEMLRIYTGAQLPPAPPPYRRFTEWREAQDVDAAKTFWTNLLAGFADPVPVGLESGASRTPGEVFEIREKLDEGTAQKLQDTARRERLTLATFLEGAWALLLSRYSGLEDIVFGTVLAGRPPGLPGADTMVGLFLNTVPMRVRTGPEQRLMDWLRSIQHEKNRREQYGHAALSDIQKWSGFGVNQPLFESLLIVENLPLSMQDAFALEGADLALSEPGSFERTHYPLTLRVFPGRETTFALNVDASRFSRKEAARLLRHIRTLLASFAADGDIRLGEIELLDEDEKQSLLQMGSGPVAEPALPVYRQILAVADEAPKKTAVVYFGTDGEKSLTYGDIASRAEALAAHLSSRGAGRGAIVAVCLARGPDLIPALLAVMKTGAAYLPIDPGYPGERVAYMLKDSGAKLIVTDRTQPAEGAAPDGIDRIDLGDVPVSGALHVPAHSRDAGPGDLAYLLYTSGSTGQPKGVPILHGALSNFLQAMTSRPGLDDNDRLLALTTVGFDIAGLELFGPLARGGQVLLADPEATRDGARFVDLVERSDPTVMQATPASWRMLLEAGWTGNPRLRKFCGGEALESGLAARLLELGGDLWNLYGPTETTIWSAALKVENGLLGSAGVPVGGAIDETQLHVLDRNGIPVPIGICGELHIGGAGLSPGYWGKPGLTAERFVPNPFYRSAGDSLHLYRTGDRVRWRENGTLEFLGRIDNQIKLRGYRIEPGEIEATLTGHPGVAEAAVVKEETGAGPRLVAYIRWQGDIPNEPAAELRTHAAETLPAYMVPRTYVSLSRFPLTPNGKVDRKALRQTAVAVRVSKETPPPVFGEPVSTLADIWRGMLKIDHITPTDNFFDLGGHSLLVITLQSAIRERLNVAPDITDIFRFPTLETMAGYIASLSGDPVGEAGGAESRGRSRSVGRERLEQRRNRRRQPLSA